MYEKRKNEYLVLKRTMINYCKKKVMISFGKVVTVMKMM